MVHVIGLGSILIIGAAVIFTGLWYQEEQRKQKAFDMANTNREPTINYRTRADGNPATDAFGLFGPESMVYELEFDATWSQGSHGKHYVNNAHFSPPVVWAGPSEAVFVVGERATAGFKEMAETGLTRSLSRELEHLIEQGTIKEYQTGQRIESPGKDTIQIRLSRDHSVISVVSRIAPSPDWIVAVEELDMLEDGRWKKSAFITTVALDAGTEEGEEFSSSNLATSPQQTIEALTDIPAQSLPPFAEITITQIGYSGE